MFFFLFNGFCRGFVNFKGDFRSFGALGRIRPSGGIMVYFV